MDFGAVFSLGSTCTPAFQLRRFFQKRPGSCFDWIVTPFNSVAEILADDGARFCLDVAPCHDGTSVICRHYGVVYHHEFHRNADGLAILSDEDRSAARSKLLYKYNKMISAARSNRTLFLRYGSATNTPGDDAITTESDLSHLVETIAAKIGHRDFEVCYVRADGYPYERSSFSGAAIQNCSFFSDPFVDGKLGTDEVWDEIFRAKGLRPSRPPIF